MIQGTWRALAPGRYRTVLLTFNPDQEALAPQTIVVGSPSDRLFKLNEDLGRVMDWMAALSKILKQIEVAESAGCPNHARRVRRILPELTPITVEIQDASTRNLLGATLEELQVRFLRSIPHELLIRWPCPECPESKAPSISEPHVPNPGEDRTSWIAGLFLRLQRIEEMAFGESLLMALDELASPSASVQQPLARFMARLAERIDGAGHGGLPATVEQEVRWLLDNPRDPDSPSRSACLFEKVRTLSHVKS
jgi:hypothetical protein